MASAGVMLVVMASLVLDFRFKRASISSSSLNVLFPYSSFHQARYCGEQSQRQCLCLRQALDTFYIGQSLKTTPHCCIKSAYRLLIALHASLHKLTDETLRYVINLDSRVHACMNEAKSNKNPQTLNTNNISN